MTEEERLAKENIDLKSQLVAIAIDRRDADKKEHEDMKQHLSRQDEKLDKLIKQGDRVEFTGNRNARRTRKIEKRLARGEIQFDSHHERIAVLEKEHIARKNLWKKIQAIFWKVAAALAVTGILAWLGFKEHP